MVVNLRSSFQTLEIKEQFLDEKKQQTAKKVQYQEFYNECARKVIHFCEQNNISYHIKEKTLIGK